MFNRSVFRRCDRFDVCFEISGIRENDLFTRSTGFVDENFVSNFDFFRFVFLANAQNETELVQQLRSGIYKSLLPRTTDELTEMINTLAVKPVRFPKIFLNGFLDLRLRLFDEHTKGKSNR